VTVKTDLKKELGLYAPRRGRFEVVTVPPLRYLMVDGHGDPNTSDEYRDAIQTIFPLAYALKFLSKRSLDRDYTVMPLEALWWADDMAAFTSARDKSQWRWTVLNLVPDWITDAHVEEATATLRSKGGAPRLDELRVETLDEGLSVQTSTSAPTTTRRRCWPSCTTCSSREPASRWPAATTRST